MVDLVCYPDKHLAEQAVKVQLLFFFFEYKYRVITCNLTTKIRQTILQMQYTSSNCVDLDWSNDSIYRLVVVLQHKGSLTYWSVCFYDN